MSKYIPIKDLEVYQIARNLSEIGWRMYKQMGWKEQKIIGDQFIEATDSVGANIAEGYHRFHYLDRIKFYYNSRASLAEAGTHWLELMHERRIVQQSLYDNYRANALLLARKLNAFITVTYKRKAVVSS